MPYTRNAKALNLKIHGAAGLCGPLYDIENFAHLDGFCLMLGLGFRV